MTDSNTVYSNQFTPPPGFEQVESQVQGITVFAPPKETSRTETPKTYTCPRCGGHLAYDIRASGIACQHCGYQQKVEGTRVGRAADEFEFTLDTLNQAEQGWGELRSQLHCDNCGAELSYPKGAVATSCPYCASNKVNVQVAEEEKLRPRFLVPFKLSKEQLPTLVSTWLGQGWFHPPELSAGFMIRRFSAVYLPFWTFDANISAEWEAEVGQQVSQRVYNAAQKRWETRTHITWHWREGQVDVSIDDLVISGVAPQRLIQTILSKTLPFDLSGLVAYQSDYLAGLQAQAYDVTLPEAWEQAKVEMRERAKQACHDDIPSTYVRNFSMSADFADESWRYIILPIYLAAYRYKDKVYQVMVNGQTGKVAGQKPVDWSKVWLAIGACLAPGALLGLVGLPLLLLGGIGISFIAFGAILFVVGLIIGFVIYNKASVSESG